MAKVTWAKGQVWRVRITGEEQNFIGEHDDNGLVIEFLKFLRRAHINPAERGKIGIGTYTGFFEEEDMPRIEAWLKYHNIEQEKFPLFM